MLIALCFHIASHTLNTLHASFVGRKTSNLAWEESLAEIDLNAKYKYYFASHRDVSIPIFCLLNNSDVSRLTPEARQ